MFLLWNNGKFTATKDTPLFTPSKYWHSVKRFQIRSLFWSVFSYILTELRKIRTRKNSVFGHFSHRVTHWKTWWFGLLLTCLSDLFYSKVAFYGRYSNIASILRNNKTLHLRCLWGHWPHFCNFWAATLLHHFFVVDMKKKIIVKCFGFCTKILWKL